MKRLFFSSRITQILAWLIVCLPTSIHAQLVSGNAFLKGNFVEVGIAPYGIWGSTVDAPAGYHARSGMDIDAPAFKKLGFVADPDKDGWDAGTPNTYNGDYFLPYNPYVGWAISAGGTRYFCERSLNGQSPGIAGFNTISAGTMISVTNTGAGSEAIWETSVHGITVRKIVTVPPDKAYFTVRTVFTNKQASAQRDIYYMEYINPDNDAYVQDMLNPTAGEGAGTINTIVYQNPADNRTLVTALGYKTRSYLGLGSLDCRARVARSTGDVVCSSGAEEIYNTGRNLAHSGSDNFVRNFYMAIAFSIGELAPGDSTAVTFAYILAEGDLEEALDHTNIRFENASKLYAPGEKIPICTGSKMPLTITNAGDDYAWTWSPSDHLDITTGKQVSVDASNIPLTYTVTGASVCGTRSLEITVDPVILTAPAAPPPVYYCLNAPPQPLTVTGSNLAWYTDANPGPGNATPPTPLTTSPGTTTWYIRETSSGCYSDPTAVTATVRPNDAATESLSICADQLPYTWHHIQIPAAGDAVATYTAANQYGCDSVITLNLTINEPPTANITKSNDINCISSKASLTASGGTHYHWHPAEGLSDPTIPNPIASPAQTTTYEVTVSNNAGCTATASVTVEVTAEGSYLLPNAFSPNNDGHNDCYGLQRASGSIGKIELSVYDRKGRMVFHTTNPQQCWDGTYAGTAQPAGTYVYHIKGSGRCGLIDDKGTVTLLR